MNRRIVTGLVSSSVVSAAGFRLGALSPSGALASVGVGGLVIWGTGWRGAVVLGAFFGSSSALSRIGRQPHVVAKGSQRDARQVFANGGVAALCALSATMTDEQRALTFVTGALAAATADTWSTEIGSLSARRPRTLIRRRVVEPGASGGVTRRGLLGAVGGAMLIGFVHGLIPPRGHVSFRKLRTSVAVTFVAGFFGSLVDSVVGELVQERRFCPSCQSPTESRLHRCGTPSVLVGGLRGIDNDVVNIACTMVGAGVTVLAARYPIEWNA